MKNKFLIISILLISKFTTAQSYFGYLNDNYAGVHSVINNPANIADSRYRTDINLLSASLFLGNDLYSSKISNFFNNEFDFERDGTKYPKESNNLLTNSDILGPSFMFNLNKKSSLAFFTRGRALYHFSNINGKALDDINNTINSSYSVKNQNYSLAANAWGEFGTTYAWVVSDKDLHFFKAGISVKYLYGLFSGFVKANNLNIDYNYTGNQFTSTTTTSGEIEIGNANSINSFDNPIKNTGSGFGGDLGLTYEYRPEHEKYQFKNQNKYKYRLQFSITDIGYIKYKDSKVTKYNANAVYTDNQSNSNLDNLYNRISETDSFVFNLPTALHLNADYKVNQSLYLNFNTDINLITPENRNSAYINNNLSITPRFEVKWLSVYTPITYLEYSGFQVGFGLRAGPLFIGSGSMISGLLAETKAADIHLGLKIPVYQGKPKTVK